MVITIDGPAGAGKSTAARRLAGAMGVSFLDTGATYRAVTLRALKAGDDLSNSDRLVEHIRAMDLKLTPQPNGLHVLLDGRDVTEDIRTEEVSQNARFAAGAPPVREELVNLQRRIGTELGDFVTEGRDQGTVVFPDADVKFYLDADPNERARRRREELAQRGEQADIETILQAILARDESDAGRSVGPLRVPDGAIRVDTTGYSIEETVEQLLRQVRERTGWEGA
ncbi:MAG: (d)CMP kinase [Phycisphaerae bacterium]|nr:(d)CMP kinase [Phycisphaerae bacterium]